MPAEPQGFQAGWDGSSPHEQKDFGGLQRPSGLTSIVQGVQTSPPNPLSTPLGQFPMEWNIGGGKSILGKSGSKWPLNS